MPITTDLSNLDDKDKAGQASTQPQDPYAPKQEGSGFTNIQRVIGANSQNQLGQAVGGGVTNAANQAGQNINQAQNDFQNQADSSNQDTQQNRDYVNNTYQGIKNQALPGQKSSGSNALDQSNAAASMYTPAGPTASTNATPGQPSAQDTQKFSQFTSGQYQGPKNIGNINNLQSQAYDVNNLQNSLNSQEGRQGLLQRFVGGNNQYTSGQQNLDALLLGQTGNNQLAQARTATQALPDLNNLSQGDQALAQTYQNRAQDLANFTKTGAQDTGKQINDYLSQQTQQKQAAADAQFNPFMQRLKSGALNSGDQDIIKNQLGLDTNGPVYGSRDQILSAITNGIHEGQYNNSNVANQQQLASQQALQQLSGLNGSDLGLNLDAKQVGTAGDALVADQGIKSQLGNLQQQGSDKFAQDYKKAGILSREELDLLNNQDIQNQFKGIGGALNAYDQQDNEGKNRAMTQSHDAEQSILARLNAQDQANGQTGFAGIQNSIADIGNYNGQRSFNRGEGVSQFLANITAQQKQRTDIEKNNQRFNSLSELLANKNTPSGGNVGF